MAASIIVFIMHVIVGAWFYFVFPVIGWKFPVVILPVLLTFFVRWAMMYTRTHYGTLETVLYYFAYTWVGLLFIFSVIILAFALLQALLALCHVPSRKVVGIISIIVLAAAAGLAI